MCSFNDLILAASSHASSSGWVRRWLVFVPSLAVLLSSLHNSLPLLFSFFPPVEELYRVLDGSAEKLAVFFYSTQSSHRKPCRWFHLRLRFLQEQNVFLRQGPNITVFLNTKYTRSNRSLGECVRYVC